MKKAIKTISAFAAAAAFVGASFASVANVSAWGDNAGGRTLYTLKQINEGVLGDTITFNSITDGEAGDERYFVYAREAGTSGVWQNGEITVESGKTYDVRLYVHNNNPKGWNAVAKNVVATFALEQNYGSELKVEGYIDSTNATPTEYWDYVSFKSANGQGFYLDYVEGSATMNYNDVDANGNITRKNVIKTISDSVITKSGYVLGDVPGCYAFSRYINIQVTPVFTDANFTVEKTVRKSGDTTWSESVNANVGDKVEYNIHYKNTAEGAVTGVAIKDILPTNLKIVGDVKLYNATNPNGLVLTGDIVKNGVGIGGYAVNGDAYIRFTAEVIDNSLICGKNTLRNWGQANVNHITLQDSADVVVQKTCKDQPTTPDTPQETVIEGEVSTPTTNTTSTPTSTVTSLPKTGPTEVAAGVVGAGSIVTAAGYYLASRKQLR